MERRILNEQDKKEICKWKYEGEYAIYDLPSYEEMKNNQIGFMNPKSYDHFYGYLENDQLIGFINLLEEEEEVFVGIGVNPKYCNQHYGQRMLLDIADLSKMLHPHKPLYLEVRTFNQRAIRCYQKAGFVIEGDAYEMVTLSGKGIFYRMRKVLDE